MRGGGRYHNSVKTGIFKNSVIYYSLGQIALPHYYTIAKLVPWCIASRLDMRLVHQGGGKPVHIKMTLFGLYLIRYQPHLSIFE
jgi:hypothetical protein